MKTTPLPALLLLICLFGLLAACEASSNRAVEQTTTLTPAADGPSTTVVTSTPSITHTMVSTITPAPATLLVKEALNIRAGPGLNYPVIGQFAPGAEAIIVGRAEAELWWKVVCPRELQLDECWVVGDPLFVEVSNAVSVAYAPAPPSPTPSPSPSLTPCVATAPEGWLAYVVEGGDTLFAIALRNGVSVGELQRVNCLESDIIVANSVLFVPGATAGSGPALPAFAPDEPPPAEPFVIAPAPVEPPAAEPAPPTAPERPGAPLSFTDAVALGLAATIRIGDPNLPPACPEAGAGRSIHIGLQATEPITTTEIAQRLYICPLGFTQTPTVTVHLPARPPERPAFDTVRGAWRWITRPGDPTGPYTVTATLGTVQASALFTVTRAADPRILVLTDEARPGEVIRVIVAGFPRPQPLYLYRYACVDEEGALCEQVTAGVCTEDCILRLHIYWQLPSPVLNPNGEGRLLIQTSIDDLPTLYLVVSDNVRLVRRNDGRFFTLK